MNGNGAFYHLFCQRVESIRFGVDRLYSIVVIEKFQGWVHRISKCKGIGNKVRTEHLEKECVSVSTVIIESFIDHIPLQNFSSVALKGGDDESIHPGFQLSRSQGACIR